MFIQTRSLTVKALLITQVTWTKFGSSTSEFGQPIASEQQLLKD